MKEIKLSSGFIALVDDQDYDRVNSVRWFPFRSRSKTDRSVLNVYAQANTRYPDGRKTSMFMHRFILSVNDRNVMVDHRDHDGLNNRRCNLRLADDSRNARNRKLGMRNTSGYKGVHSYRDRWVAHIKANGKMKHLGVFQSREEAARAYNDAALEYFGEFAFLNVVPSGPVIHGKINAVPASES